jgi:hypothetical protein
LRLSKLPGAFSNWPLGLQCRVEYLIVKPGKAGKARWPAGVSSALLRRALRRGRALVRRAPSGPHRLGAETLQLVDDPRRTRPCWHQAGELMVSV